MSNAKDLCATCGTDLATCKTIWATITRLYCSKSCGYHDIKDTQLFDIVAEELNPADIGIFADEHDMRRSKQ